jgi:8-oxo-dGTP diphosphatase
MRSTALKALHIAVGVLQNARGEVLVCQRPPHKIYPGEWEFPGGKVEPGEAVDAALRRELREELGLTLSAARPLIRLQHAYPELAVDLDTWLVTGYAGELRSTEHPAIAWVPPEELPRWPLLAADRPIVNALRLPAHCIFTPPTVPPAGLVRQARALPRGLLRVRLPALSDAQYGDCVRDLAAALAATGHPLILDRDPADVARAGAAGFHATAATLRRLPGRPVAGDKWFGASCHSIEELARARALGADYVVVGPVRATVTHPDAPALGWPGFAELAWQAGLPVYAIGGVGPADLEAARAHGAHGVAGISAYWRALGSGDSGGAPGS